MGGKKKTKWRKLPLEELSHVTTREGAKDAKQFKYHHIQSGTSRSSAESELKTEVGPETGDEDKYRIEPGFYINGLWLPMAELESSIMPCNTLPLNIVSSVPMILNLPPMYCPSPSAFHSHDGVYNPLIYPSDLRFYYNPRTEPTDLCKKYEAGGNYRVMDVISATSCNDSSGRKKTLLHNNTMSTTKAEAATVGDDILHATALLDRADCETVTDVPYVTSEIMVPMYQHPGCSFGPALHNIPFQPAVLPAYPERVIQPWSSAHFHKRRRKKKGYAEYAIIPKKVASSSSLNTNKSITVSANEPYSNLSQKRPSETVSTACERPQSNGIIKKMIINELCNDMSENNVGPEISTYTTALVENILLKAKEELQLNASHTEKSIQLNDTDGNQISPILVPVETMTEVVLVHKGGGSENGNKKFSETHPTKWEVVSETNDALGNNTNNNTDIIAALECADSNHSDKDQNTGKAKNESEISFPSVKDSGDVVNVMKRYVSNIPNVSEQLNNSVEYSIAESVSEASNAEKLPNKINSATTLFDYENSPQNSRSFKNEDSGCSDEMRSLQNFPAAIASTEETKLGSAANTQKSTSGKYSVAEESERQPANRFHFSSDTFMHETELELNKLHQLTTKSEFQNQFIYKLAYDESITDQSEVEDQEMPNEIVSDTKQMFQSCQSMPHGGTRSEILVHEIDSASDAGSEDVELLPHRYESESAQRNGKHIYVNNLSLAVELLRTRERLPYDEEFKRIVGEDGEQHGEQSKSMSAKLPSHTVRQSVVTNSLTRDPNRIVQNETSLISNNQEAMNHIQSISTKNFVPNKKMWNSRVSAKGVRLEESVEEDEMETTDQSRLNLSERVDRNNIGAAQVKQQFHMLASRTGIINPCLCCIIL